MAIIESLIENERSVSKLYTVFADRFGGEKEFWLHKANEEKAHAELLESLRELCRQAPALYEEERFSPEAVNLVSELVKDALEKANNCSLIEALTMAREIENSLIERNFFKVIPGDSALVREAFVKIEQDTKEHREEIQELWLRYVSK